MALSSCPALVVSDSSLEGWRVIGSGGFGQIYKARHLQWCCDVAVKLLHYDDGTSSSLLREVNMMRQGSSPYVIQVLGVFQGRPPSSGPSAQLGLVMEFMERGSLASLQSTSEGPPPWPLVFRLAHQVALGINFLHSLTPALLHLDLKPSNVLLDSSLNAKLTDFGLAKFYNSISRASKKDNGDEGGTLSYMPPEAFGISYAPSRASDIYSYGILLWSVVTGKQPYANAISTIVRFRIPQGDRPALDEIRCQAAGRAGLTGLMELMVSCWETKSDQRPSSYECTTVTEELYKMHKHAIHDAVYQVLTKLDEKEEERMSERVQRVHISQPPGSANVEAVTVCDHVPTGRPPIQEMNGGWAASQRVKDLPSPLPASTFDAEQPRSTAAKVKASSVQPIDSSPPSPSSRRFQSRTVRTSPQDRLSPQYQRQFSSPDSVSSRCLPGRLVNMHLCNVTGLQIGKHNNMHIYAADPFERKRHPTAPSTINLPSPH